MDNCSAQRFKRGQMWWYDPVEQEGAVIQKRRTMVILSADSENSRLATLMIAPITSSDRPDSSINVRFKKGAKYYTVVCHQVTTISVNQVCSYDSTMSEEVLEKVEKAVSNALGLKPARAQLSDIENLMNEVYTKYMYEAEKQSSALVTDLILEDFKYKLMSIRDELHKKGSINFIEKRIDEMITSGTGEEIKPVEKKVKTTDNTEDTEKTTKPSSTTSKTGKKRRRWTDAEKIQFVEDSLVMNDKQLQKKWNINTLGTVRTTKRRFMLIYDDLRAKVESEEGKKTGIMELLKG